MIRAHLDAFKALVAAVPNAPTSYDGKTPNNTPPGYVVYINDPGSRSQVDLADANPQMMWTIRTTCVGVDLHQANALMEKVRQGVEGKRPVVAGRVCTRVKQLLARPAERDDDDGVTVFYVIADWRWYSHPA